MSGYDIHCPAANSVQNGPLRDQSLLEVVGKALRLLSRLSDVIKLMPTIHACEMAKRKPIKLVLRMHFIAKV